jgi:hypothetical protein
MTTGAGEARRGEARRGGDTAGRRRRCNSQRVSVQAGPGPTFEVPQPEFLLELLVRLLTFRRPLMAAANARSGVSAGRLLR